MSLLLKENDYIRETVNLNQYLENGYDGSSVHAVIFDTKAMPREFLKDIASAPFCKEKIISHGTNVCSVLAQMLPKLKITMLPNSDEAREYFKQIADTVDIVNISMSAGQDLAEHNWGFLEQYKFLPIFASSGNDGEDRICFPSAFSWVISVGAYTNGNVTTYSNRGDVDCVGFTNVSVLNSEMKSFKFSGTSCSSPQIASTFGAYVDFVKKNLNRKVTRQEAFDFIHNNTIDLYQAGRDDKSGYGIFRLKNLNELKKELIKPIESKPIPPEIIIPKPNPIPNPIPQPNPEPKPIEEKPINGDDNTMPKYKVVVNAGHGLKNNGTIDVGAVGITGYKEYIETKEIADLVSAKLKYNGVDTLVTQDGDLWDVTNKANEYKADYFVSIHANSFSNPTAHGVESFSLATTGNGRQLAESIHKELIPATGLYDRGLKTANYHVLKETDMSAVLIEVGFLSNPKEEALMKDPVWDEKVSNAIAKGICNFLNISYKQPSISIPSNPAPTPEIMYRVIIDGKQVMALSNQESAIAKVKELIDSSPTAKLGIVQRNTDSRDLFSYSKSIQQPTKHLVMGKAEITIQQAEEYLHKINPYAPCYAQIYKEEAEIEGVRWDIAFAQSLKEANFFRFGGDAKEEWHNFAGIGVTGVKYIPSQTTEKQFVDGVVEIKDENNKDVGVKFNSPRLGIRCQIQHLKAYSSSYELVNECVDPRFKYIKRNIAPYIEDYGSGVWASDTNNYGGCIWKFVEEMKNTTVSNIKKSGKIIFYIYPADSRASAYLSDYLDGVKYVDIKDMNYDMWNMYEEIIQVGGEKVNSNVTLLLSGADRYNTLISVLKYMGKIK